MFSANLKIIGTKRINKNSISVHLCAVSQDYMFSADYFAFVIFFNIVGFCSASHEKKKLNSDVNHPTSRANKPNIAAVHQIFWNYFLSSRGAHFIEGHYLRIHHFSTLT